MVFRGVAALSHPCPSDVPSANTARPCSPGSVPEVFWFFEILFLENFL